MNHNPTFRSMCALASYASAPTDQSPAETARIMADQLAGLIDDDPLLTADTRLELRGLSLALGMFAERLADAEPAVFKPRAPWWRRMWRQSKRTRWQA